MLPPAALANFGSGFDCIGMAFKLYNHLWVEEYSMSGDESLVIETKNGGEFVPLDKTNLIYKSIVRFYGEVGIRKPVPSIKLTQDDAIPLTRGLGSSAACIAAGLLAANALSNANLPRDQICYLAAKIEGHPDNSTPALVGGLTVGVVASDKLEYIKIESDKLKELKFAALIPEFFLLTEKSRGALPEQIPLKDAVFNISRAALLAAALSQGDFSKLSTACDDALHQPYRMQLVPNMTAIFNKAYKLGAKAVFLSGAGPTIMTVYQNDTFLTGMGEYLENLPNAWTLNPLEADYDGAIVEKI
ncbi:homoserine kinase [Clostridia bacterium]|nr:homoserine kinase [Clostridia bacterium]